MCVVNSNTLISKMATGCLSKRSHDYYCINSVVRGHYIYKDIWMPEIREELMCQKEVGNIHDLHAVAVSIAATWLVMYHMYNMVK